MALVSRGVHDALARSQSLRLGPNSMEALAVDQSLVETRCGLRWTHGSTNGSLHGEKVRRMLRSHSELGLVYGQSFTSARTPAQKGDLLLGLPAFSLGSVPSQIGEWTMSTTVDVNDSSMFRDSLGVLTCDAAIQMK